MRKLKDFKPKKFNTPFEFGFDVTKTDIKSLKSKEGFIVWTCIAQTHLLSEDFDDKVQNFLKYYKDVKPDTYSRFKFCVSASGLRDYGSDYIEIYGSRILDDEWWMGVYNFFQYPEEFQILYEDKLLNLDNLNLAEINPQLFI